MQFYTQDPLAEIKRLLMASANRSPAGEEEQYGPVQDHAPQVVQLGVLPPARSAENSVVNKNQTQNQQSQSNINQDRVVESESDKTSRPPLLEPTVLKDFYNQINALPEIKNYTDLVKQYEETLKQAQTEPHALDLSPFYKLIDWRSGSNLSRGYRPPVSNTQKKLATLKEMIEARGGVAKLQQDLLTIGKGGSDVKELLRRVENFVQNSEGAVKTDTQSGQSTNSNKSTTGRPGVSSAQFNALSKQLGDKMAPFIGLVTQFNKLDKELGGIDNWKGKDIPGSGATGWAPLFALSSKGSVNKELITGIQNELLYLKSGAQINEQEYKRLTQAIGGGLMSSDRDRINGLKTFRDVLQNIFQSRQASFPKEVVDAYVSRGGLGYHDVAKIGAGGGNRQNGVLMISPGGKQGRVSADKVEEAIKAGYKRAE